MTRILNAETLTSHGNVRGRKALVEILEAGLQAADPYYTTRSMLHLDGEILTVGRKEFEPAGDPQSYYNIQQALYARCTIGGLLPGIERLGTLARLVASIHGRALFAQLGGPALEFFRALIFGKFLAQLAHGRQRPFILRCDGQGLVHRSDSRFDPALTFELRGS